MKYNVIKNECVLHHHSNKLMLQIGGSNWDVYFLEGSHSNLGLFSKSKNVYLSLSYCIFNIGKCKHLHCTHKHKWPDFPKTWNFSTRNLYITFHDNGIYNLVGSYVLWINPVKSNFSNFKIPIAGHYVLVWQKL